MNISVLKIQVYHQFNDVCVCGIRSLHDTETVAIGFIVY